ncbi:MAG: alpha/beta fold hydrolase [Planctomycetales bacterium]|nr:alpha/beta fold hydrolase [Planctomycetales bacterium]
MNSSMSLPPFCPHRLVIGGHAQTLAGFLLPFDSFPYTAQSHHVELDDGDQIVLHEDRPPEPISAAGAVLLVHGLCGCHGSGYMQRVAAKFLARGVRVFRMDMRGCGAGEHLARHPMHSDRTSDVLAALNRIAAICPSAGVSLIGFSLGGNLVLNTASAIGSSGSNLARVLAVCPPIDLIASSRFMSRPAARIYERHFVSLLLQHVRQRNRRLQDLPPIRLARRPRSRTEFDHLVTAPLAGFRSGEEYYRKTSPAPRLASIRVPTKIIAAANDPLVPACSFADMGDSEWLDVVVTNCGGHLGFISDGRTDPDRRWIDWRCVDWVD